MDLRKHTLEAVTLIAAAALCALVANTVASRERKIVLVGTYPNATKVPAPAPETTTAPSVTDSSAVTTTRAASPTGAGVPEPVPSTMTGAPPANTSPTQTSRPTTQPRNPTTQQPSTAATQQSPTAATHQPPPAATQEPGNPTPPQQGSPATARDLSKYAPHPDKAYIEIAYKDVAALYAGGALFLDARRTNVYEQGHIAGARPFSVWESDADDKVKGLWEQRQDPKEQALPIVIYCTGGDCEDSHMLAQKLWGAQFSNIYVYKDGFPDWQAKGGATHTGTQP